MQETTSDQEEAQKALLEQFRMQLLISALQSSPSYAQLFTKTQEELEHEEAQKLERRNAIPEGFEVHNSMQIDALDVRNVFYSHSHIY